MLCSISELELGSVVISYTKDMNGYGIHIATPLKLTAIVKDTNLYSKQDDSLTSFSYYTTATSLFLRIMNLQGGISLLHKILDGNAIWMQFRDDG